MSENLLTFSTLELLLAGITGVLFIIQIVYHLVTYARPLRTAKTAESTEQATVDKETQPVSVIVYAHGEPEDLRNNLPVLLNQDYPDYEVIVVNDGSDADSEDILKLFSNEYKNLYYTYVPVDTQYLSHKKLALTMGSRLPGMTSSFSPKQTAVRSVLNGSRQWSIPTIPKQILF